MRKCVYIIFIMALFLCNITIVKAATQDRHICEHGYHTFSDYHMGYGVGQYGKNTRYYYAKGFDSTHMKHIANAVSEWVYTSSGYPNVKTSISIKKTTTKSKALFEIINTSTLSYYALGQTKFYLYQDEIIPVGDTLPKNYGWARCLISVEAFNRFNVTAENRKGTIAHELGHAMGLSHQNKRPASIMCQTSEKRTATRADATDCKTINHIYG